MKTSAWEHHSKHSDLLHAPHSIAIHLLASFSDKSQPHAAFSNQFHLCADSTMPAFTPTVTLTGTCKWSCKLDTDRWLAKESIGKADKLLPSLLIKPISINTWKQSKKSYLETRWIFFFFLAGVAILHPVALNAWDCRSGWQSLISLIFLF